MDTETPKAPDDRLFVWKRDESNNTLVWSGINQSYEIDLDRFGDSWADNALQALDWLFHIDTSKDAAMLAGLPAALRTAIPNAFRPPTEADAWEIIGRSARARGLNMQQVRQVVRAACRAYASETARIRTPWLFKPLTLKERVVLKLARAGILGRERRRAAAPI